MRLQPLPTIVRHIYCKTNYSVAGQESLEPLKGLVELSESALASHRLSKKLRSMRAQCSREMYRQSTDWAPGTRLHSGRRHRRRSNEAHKTASRDYTRTNRCGNKISAERLQATNEDIISQMNASLTRALHPTYEEIWVTAWRAIKPPKPNEERCA